jgi:hypothetical protein
MTKLVGRSCFSAVAAAAAACGYYGRREFIYYRRTEREKIGRGENGEGNRTGKMLHMGVFHRETSAALQPNSTFI